MKSIKKILCSILVLAMAFSMMSFSVSAEETEFTVAASVNYDTSVVTVEVATPAKYVQKISVVMYEKETGLNNTDDIIRAINLYTDGSGYVKTDVQLAEDDPAGYITISAAGNGTKAAISKDTTDIYFESQTYIADVTLPAIESAGKEEIAAILDEKADMLLVDRADLAENTDVICDLFLNIRKEDYNNNCEDMGTVVDILSGINLIRNINAVTTEDECKALCEADSTLLTLNAENADYSKKKADIYKLFYKNAKNEAPKCITDVKNDLFQSIAMANFNNLDATKVGPTVEKYIEYFGISLDEYNEACEEYGASEINKTFVGRNFVFSDEVVAAFKDVVENAEESSSSSGSTGGGGGGGGGFSGGTSGKKEELSVDKELVENTENAEVLPELPSDSFFNDVPSGHWAYTAVNELYCKGIVNGVAQNTFDPDSTVTREAFVKMFILALDLYDSTSLTIYTDLLGHWANLYVASAQVKGIVKGIDNYTFGVGMPITRQDAAVMLMRAIDYKKIELEGNSVKSFDDEAEISDYAKESVAKLSAAGIISGMTENEFQPTGNLTRAQAAKLIYSIIK